MCVRATAKIKIETRPEIARTIEVYKRGLQFCIDKAWEMKIRNNIKLHPFVYRELREIGLPSQLAVRCIKQSCGMVKRVKTKPHIENVSIGYNFPRSASMKNNILSISTIDGRIKVPFSVPACFGTYFDNWEVCESLLMIDKFNRTFFLFTFCSDVETHSSNTQRVLGVDVGVNTLAVTSERRFYGEEIKQKRVQHDRFVSKLQSKGTRASKRKLKRLSGSWRQFMRWENHNISKRIVDSLNKGDTVVMEDLIDIRKTARYNKWIHKWAFRQLRSFIEYKSLMKGIRVVYINPRYTSKTCSRCHNTDTVRHRGFVECKTCGYSLNSDFNASINIAQLYKRNMCRAIVNKPDFSCDDSVLCVQHFEHDVSDEYRDNQLKKRNAPLVLLRG